MSPTLKAAMIVVGGVALLLAIATTACATQRPWLTARVGCEELDLPPAVVSVARCTEVGFDFRACLLVYGDTGISCVSQYERTDCAGPWVERAHQCQITLEPAE